MSKQSQSPPRGDKPTPTAPPPPPAWRHWLWPIGLLAAVVLFLFLPRVSGVPSVNLTYSQFLSDVNAHKVKTFTLDNSTGSTAPGTGTLKDGKDYTTVVPLPFAGTPLATTLEKAGVNIDAAPPSTGFGTELLFLLISLLPIIFVFWLIRRMSQAGGAAGPLGGLTGVGRARAKVFDAERPQTKFSDVAGYQSAKREISEVVDFLKHPERYRRLGAVAPRGVLMVGPPGTGKTLMARAVAGEAEVPFLALTGSSFVELFVGVGASRVRDLFADARKRAPSIIFIDEIEALAARRCGDMNATRDGALTELLQHIDGMEAAERLFILGATNRLDMVDEAMLRPGRLGEHVEIGLPGLMEREAIFRLCLGRMTCKTPIAYSFLSRATDDFSPADIKACCNEAGRRALARGAKQVTQADLIFAVEARRRC